MHIFRELEARFIHKLTKSDLTTKKTNLQVNFYSFLASTTGGLWAIRDAGEHWHCVSSDLPPVAAVRFAP